MSFEIFYNALSVGWHLRRIKELDKDFMRGDDLWKKFVGWLERHEIKEIL